MDENKTVNYTSDSIIELDGTEKIKNVGTNKTILNFWEWAYSDIIRNTKRGIFAEYLVKLALDVNGCYQESPIRLEFEPFDLLGPPKKSDGKRSRLEIKSASNIQSWQPHTDDYVPNIRFSIAPAKVPDETGDYPRNAGRQRNCDIYIFSYYTSETRGGNVMDSDHWKFYICSTYILEEKYKDAKTISLKNLKPISTICEFKDIYISLTKICENI